MTPASFAASSFLSSASSDAIASVTTIAAASTSFSHYFILFLTFCIVLFFYLHIQHQFKTSNELEVFDLSAESAAYNDHSLSKERLEEVLELRQPTLFHSHAHTDLNFIQQSVQPTLFGQHYMTFEIKIRDLVDDLREDTQLHVPLQFHLSQKLFSDDTHSRFISENNHDFLAETGALKTFQYNDRFLRPPLLAQCWYDFWLGSSYAETPLRYFINYRNFFMVTHGTVRVKLIPPQYSKYMHATKDYDNFEFRSPISPWYPQPSYQSDFYKTKSIELNLTAGQVLSVPPYWWHSFQFEPSACVAVFYYRTYMNVVAILPELCMSALQRQNVKNKYMKTLPLHPSSDVPGDLSRAPPVSAASTSTMQHTTTFGVDNLFVGYVSGISDGGGNASGTIDKTPFSLFTPTQQQAPSSSQPDSAAVPVPVPTEQEVIPPPVSLSTGVFGEHPSVAGMLGGRPEPRAEPHAAMGSSHIQATMLAGDGGADVNDKYAAINTID